MSRFATIPLLAAFAAALLVAGCTSDAPKPSPTRTPIPTFAPPSTYSDGSPLTIVDTTCIDQFTPLLDPLYALHSQIIQPEKNR